MLPPEEYAALREDGKRLFSEMNQSAGGSRLTLESDYLQVLARKA
jgi:hypothetical protein